MPRLYSVWAIKWMPWVAIGLFAAMPAFLTLQYAPRHATLLLWVFVAFLCVIALCAPTALARVGVVAVSIMGIGLGTLVWGCVNSAAVAGAAETEASGRPYCLQVPMGNEGTSYRTVTSKADLNGLWMQAPSAGIFPHWSFHAVLVVDAGDPQPQLWNWSYRFRAFRRISDNARERLKEAPLAPYCVPRTHFMRGLPPL